MERLLAESPGPIRVEKHGRGPPLWAPVRRIFYLSAEGTMREHEVFPPPNPRLLAQVDSADAIVYGMGSLYTSICPSLVLTVGRCWICTSPHHHPHHIAVQLQVAYIEYRHPLLAVKEIPSSPLLFSSQRAAGHI